MFRKVFMTPSSYNYQLLLKRIWETPLIYFPDNEIVYRSQKRYSYSEFYLRLKKVANMLASIGVETGDVVGVMDWDTTRFLELFNAIPMSGSVIHTINVRLSPDQVLYTINHAEDKILFVNEEFIPIIEIIKDKFTTVKEIIFMSEERV